MAQLCGALRQGATPKLRCPARWARAVGSVRHLWLSVAPPPGFDGSPIYLGCGRSVPACERLTTVGLVTGGGGLALIAGSAALLFTPDRVIADEPAYVRNYSRAGTTLMAIGIGLATTGVLMLLTAARAANKRRRLDASLAARGR